MSPHGEGRRYHEANAGRDSKPVIFIFEGNNILWMLLGCGLALLVFRLGHDHLNWSLGGKPLPPAWFRSQSPHFT
ncbi:MAG: hypothetical protein R3F19_12660 [Verrucomicrobiales bacterium]